MNSLVGPTIEHGGSPVNTRDHEIPFSTNGVGCQKKGYRSEDNLHSLAESILLRTNRSIAARTSR